MQEETKSKIKGILLIFFFVYIFAWGISGCDVGKAQAQNLTYKDDGYVFKHRTSFKWVEGTDGWGKFRTAWSLPHESYSLNYSTSIVRDGKYSIKFETRAGDCNDEDCDRRNEGGNTNVHGSISHTELSFPKDYKDKGIKWYAWSMYIPNETLGYYEADTTLGQWKMPTEFAIKKWGETGTTGDGVCYEIPIQFKLKPEGLVLFKHKFQDRDKCPPKTNKFFKHLIIPTEVLKDRWHDLLLEVKWTNKEDGYINLWVGDELVYTYTGQTFSMKLRNSEGRVFTPNFRIGIYSGNRHNEKNWKTQIVYFDEFARNKKCSKASKYHNCKMLSSKLTDYGIYKEIWETNYQAPKNEKKIIKTLTTRITNKIILTADGVDYNKVHAWVFEQLSSMDWDDNLDKLKDRRPTQERLIKNGIKKFSI